VSGGEEEKSEGKPGGGERNQKGGSRPVKGREVKVGQKNVTKATDKPKGRKYKRYKRKEEGHCRKQKNRRGRTELDGQLARKGSDDKDTGNENLGGRNTW